MRVKSRNYNDNFRLVTIEEVKQLPLNSKNLNKRQYSTYGSANRAITTVEKREGITFDKVAINQIDEDCFEVLIY